MSYKSLREFIERLEREGRLVRVTEAVSTNLEMTEIQTRLLAEGGPAVLFENVVDERGEKSAMPVLVNLFASTVALMNLPYSESDNIFATAPAVG